MSRSSQLRQTLGRLLLGCLVGAAALAGVADFARERGVWLRPFGRWLYTMPAYVTSNHDLRRITEVMKHWFIDRRAP